MYNNSIYDEAHKVHTITQKQIENLQKHFYKNKAVHQMAEFNQHHIMFTLLSSNLLGGMDNGSS